jgi:hypothetical protein
MSSIRRTHLNHTGTGVCHHIGHPKVAADFHEFSTRNDRLPVAGENSKDQERGRRAVVYDEGVLGPGQILQQRLCPDAAATTRPALDVVFNGAIACSTIDSGSSRL